MLTVLAGDGVSGAPTPGPAISSALGSPTGIASDAAGNLYIADQTSLVIEKITPAGALSVIAGDGQPGAPTPGPATSSALAMPIAVAVDGQGDVYIADAMNDVVEKVTPAGTLSIIAGRVGQAGAPTPGPATSTDVTPFGLAVDSAGDVYITDDYDTSTSTAAYILKVTPSGMLSIFAGTGLIGSPTPGPATSSEFNFPAGLALDGSGNLYIADVYANVVAKVTPAGTLSIVAGNGQQSAPVAGPATSSPLNNPYGVAIDGAGDLYIADSVANSVLSVSPGGILSVFAGTGRLGLPTPGPATGSDLNNPLGVAVDGSRNVYIADTGNADVEEVFSGIGTTTTTGTTSTTSGTGLPESATGPTVTGTGRAGHVLTCSPGAWTNGPDQFIYQWTADGTAIAGAAKSTYRVTSNDEQLTIRCVVVAVNGAGGSAPTTSNGIAIPVPRVAGCPAATGRLAGSRLGPIRLGMTRAQAHAAFRRSSNRGKKFEDFFCLTPIGVRVGYGSPTLLRTLLARERSRFANRVVWASTASRYYAIDGVRAGEAIAATGTTLHTGSPFRIGANDWYLARTTGSTVVLKVRRGIVEEVGIADRSLTTTRTAQHALLTSFS